jgi:hypothetical protein
MSSVLVFTFPSEDVQENCFVQAEVRDEVVVLLNPATSKILCKNRRLY